MKTEVEIGDGIRISVYDETGKIMLNEILQKAGKGEINILDLSDLKSGRYLIHFEGGGFERTITVIRN